MLLLLLACDPTPEPDTNHAVCGTIVLDGECPQPSSVEVWSILDGATPCDDTMDSGGIGTEWRDSLVATATIDENGNFTADVDAGTYALTSAAGDCDACISLTVTGDTCTPVELPLQELVHADAPNVYLYPEVTTPVLVRLGQPEALTLVDPPYPADGWRVVANPDGQIESADGPRDYLYYEQTVRPGAMQTTHGWCVDGPQAQASIEDSMADLGFSTTEIADFSAYWDGVFPRVGTLTVYPQLRGLPALQVSPPPDSVLRAWFTVAPGCADVPMPELPSFVATGFVVTEWGVVLHPALPREQPLLVDARR